MPDNQLTIKLSFVAFVSLCGNLRSLGFLLFAFRVLRVFRGLSVGNQNCTISAHYKRGKATGSLLPPLCSALSELTILSFLRALRVSAIAAAAGVSAVRSVLSFLCALCALCGKTCFPLRFQVAHSTTPRSLMVSPGNSW